MRGISAKIVGSTHGPLKAQHFLLVQLGSFHKKSSFSREVFNQMITAASETSMLLCAFWVSDGGGVTRSRMKCVHNDAEAVGGDPFWRVIKAFSQRFDPSCSANPYLDNSGKLTVNARALQHRRAVAADLLRLGLKVDLPKRKHDYLVHFRRGVANHN